MLRAHRLQTLPRIGSLGLAAALAFAMLSSDASAAALGSLGSSAGLLTALAAMLLVKAWPSHGAGGALSALTGVLVIVAGTTWWRRPAAPKRLAIALPAEIDRKLLLRELRSVFIALQAAWDRGDMPALQTMTLPPMLEEMCALRPAEVGNPGTLRSEVVTLRAELLGFESLAGDYLVSISFSGAMREAPGMPPMPFRELWMLTRARQPGAGWRLARHQALL